nr:MAG TPA: hypothetical protein [Caudoviricetes sp.]
MLYIIIKKVGETNVFIARIFIRSNIISLLFFHIY